MAMYPPGDESFALWTFPSSNKFSEQLWHGDDFSSHTILNVNQQQDYNKESSNLEEFKAMYQRQRENNVFKYLVNLKSSLCTLSSSPVLHNLKIEKKSC